MSISRPQLIRHRGGRPRDRGHSVRGLRRYHLPSRTVSVEVVTDTARCPHTPTTVGVAARRRDPTTRQRVVGGQLPADTTMKPDPVSPLPHRSSVPDTGRGCSGHRPGAAAARAAQVHPLPRNCFAQRSSGHAHRRAHSALRLACGAGALEQDVPLVVGEHTPPPAARHPGCPWHTRPPAGRFRWVQSRRCSSSAPRNAP